jgi:alanine racemase
MPVKSAEKASTLLRPVWCEIDLDAVVHNLRELRRLVGPEVKIFACLKRNAYGCGAISVARVAVEEGAAGLALADPFEGVRLRRAGIGVPILLYAGALPEMAGEVLEHGLCPTVSNLDEARAYSNAAARPTEVFVKVDVGLYRAGVLAEEAVPLIIAVAGLPRLRIGGIYTHLNMSRADEAPGYPAWQFERFTRILTELDRQGLHVPVRMVASTPVVLRHPEMALNAVDPGRFVYGIMDSGKPSQPVDLRPALRAIKCRLILRREVRGPDPFRAKAPLPARDGMLFGILPLGWGDGLPARPAAPMPALVRGRRTSLVGSIHLEHSRVDLTACQGAEAGDEVVLLGAQGEDRLSHEEVARAWGSSVTELACAVRDHVPRLYFRDGELVDTWSGPDLPAG